MSSNEAEPDRHSIAPQHVGLNIFPNFYLFSRLVRLAHKDLTAVNDTTFGYKVSYVQLLTDTLHLRNILQSSLHVDVRRKLEQNEEVFVTLVGPAGYEFVVGFMALMALGAAIVPISLALPVKEAAYFATKSKSCAVITANASVELARELRDHMQAFVNPRFQYFEIKPNVMQPCLRPQSLLVSSDKYFDLNTSGLIIFTSGTTGPPKAAVKRRGFFYDVAQMFGDQHGLREKDVVLHVLPVHHATGVTATLLPFLWCGGCIEFRSGGFDVVWTWERIRKGDLDFFSGVPTMYMRLMQHFEQTLSKLPPATVEEYAQGARRIRGMLCGTSALPRPLQQKWIRLREGAPILTRYGGTEFGSAFSTTPWMREVPDGSVGKKTPCVDVKLSSEPEGEILMRSSVLFSKYLSDSEATREILDEDGYFKTGDIARREGEYYYILGRASIDIIKSGGYKISALDIEREILGLDYISEVMVVGVEDEEYGQRVAAAIVLNPNDDLALTIDKLRSDLGSSLARYKMPTLLRVVPELRKNATGKVLKKVLVKEVFPAEGHPDIQRWQSSNSGSKL